ncbi:MAG: hypothetical protein ACPHX1_00885 [Porticoccaceae bacterium]
MAATTAKPIAHQAHVGSPFSSLSAALFTFTGIVEHPVIEQNNRVHIIFFIILLLPEVIYI